MTGVVLFMVSSAFVLAWVVSAEGIPQAAAEWVVNSLKSMKTRHRNCQLVRRKGRVYVINKTNRRFKARQG